MIVILTDSLHFPQSCCFFQKILLSSTRRIVLSTNSPLSAGKIAFFKDLKMTIAILAMHFFKTTMFKLSNVSISLMHCPEVRNTYLAQDRYTLWEIVHVVHQSATLESFGNVSFKDYYILNETCSNHNAHFPEYCALQRMLHSMFESSNKVSSCLVCNWSSCILKLQVMHVLEGILHHSKTYCSLSQEFCLFIGRDPLG